TLDSGEAESFAGLTRHQMPAWHMFCVQLAALACERSGLPVPPVDEIAWRAALRTLAGTHGDDAWRLVVDDLSRPAFLQPAVPERTLAGFAGVATTPDAIDVLVTAKNHDVKQARAAAATADLWV